MPCRAVLHFSAVRFWLVLCADLYPHAQDGAGGDEEEDDARNGDEDVDDAEDDGAEDLAGLSSDDDEDEKVSDIILAQFTKVRGGMSPQDHGLS